MLSGVSSRVKSKLYPEVDRSKHHKDYEKTQVKHEWRLRVWKAWQQLSGQQRIPADKQYWTLGDRTLKNGDVTGELKSIQQYGLLESMRSFISVNFEFDKAVDNLPPCLTCGLYLREHGLEHDYVHGADWLAFYGDIEQLVPLFDSFDRFHPALINLDTTHFPEKAYSLAGKVGRYCPPGTFIALNVIDDFMSRTASMNEVLDYRHNHHLSHAKLHDMDIRYQNGTCHLVTIFLEF